jgi:hypothetical protein
MAVADEYKLDKEQSVENDVLNVFRLEMDIYVLSNQKSLLRVFHIIQTAKTNSGVRSPQKNGFTFRRHEVLGQSEVKWQ